MASSPALDVTASWGKRARRSLLSPAALTSFLLVLALTACGGGAGATGVVNPLCNGIACNVITTVAVSFGSAQISVNGTTQASAVVEDQNGNAYGGAAVKWESLSPSVATVSSSGSVKGVAPGIATIKAVSGAVSGSAAIVVK